MTTDTIPEAREAAARLFDALQTNFAVTEQDRIRIITQACLAYHKRHSQELEKQCDDLRTRAMNAETEVARQKLIAEKAEASLKERSEAADFYIAQFSKNEKEIFNQANEVAQLREAVEAARLKDLGSNIWHYVCIHHTDKERDKIDCYICLKNQLTQLQQDVRPLVAIVRETMQAHRDKDSNEYNECDDIQCHWCEIAETFLAKHPECKQEV